MATITLKRNDTYPDIVRTLTQTIDGETTPIDLTDAVSVELILKPSSGSGTGGGACDVTDAAAGEVTYELQAADTDTARTWNAEYEITWPGGRIETVPNDDYFTILVKEDLG